jgi:hypothetical protein
MTMAFAAADVVAIVLLVGKAPAVALMAVIVRHQVSE